LHSSRIAEAFALGDEELADALQPSTVENLSVLAAGRMLAKPAWAYDSGDLPGIVEILEARFDLVVFDLPAVSKASSAARLAALLDGVLMVVEADRVPSVVARKVRHFLAHSNVHLLGGVLNKCRRREPALV